MQKKVARLVFEIVRLIALSHEEDSFKIRYHIQSVHRQISLNALKCNDKLQFLLFAVNWSKVDAMLRHSDDAP